MYNIVTRKQFNRKLSKRAVYLVIQKEYLIFASQNKPV